MRSLHRLQSTMLSLMHLPARDAELVQIMDASLAEAARRAGAFLACRIGCTQCCYGAFAINALDAARLREGMLSLRKTDPALAAEIERRARVWLAKYASDFPGDSETGVLGTSDADQASFEGFANDAACPALDPASGRCDVYAWRPMTCRVFGPPVRSVNENGAEGLGYCELCFIDATPEQVAACEMPVPHELEAELLEEIESEIGSPIQSIIGSTNETIVAFALIE